MEIITLCLTVSRYLEDFLYFQHTLLFHFFVLTHIQPIWSQELYTLY